MNRTASDGHETLRSLLLHTGDPLPLVLALDDMDPDDPTTQRTAGRLVSYLRACLRDAHTRQVYTLFPNEYQPGFDRTRETDRLTKLNLTPPQRQLLLSPIRTPNTLSPADALATTHQTLEVARKLGTPLTLSPYYRHQLAKDLQGPPTFFIGPPHYDPAIQQQNCTISTQAADRPIMEAVLNTIQRETGIRQPELPPANTNDLHVHLRLSFDTDAQVLPAVESWIKAQAPTAHIFKS